MPVFFPSTAQKEELNDFLQKWAASPYWRQMAGDYGIGDATVTALAHAAGVAVPTVTRMLGGLERDGIVERHRVDHDRRIVRVRLTPAGRDLMAEKRVWILERLRAVYDGLTPAERRAATPLMRRFGALLAEL